MLSDEETKRQIENEQKRIELMLAAVKSGSEQEFQLKLELMNKQMEASAECGADGKRKGFDSWKYRVQEDTLIDAHTSEIRQKQMDAVKLDFDTRIAEAYGNEQAILELKVQQKQAVLMHYNSWKERVQEFNLRKLNMQNEFLDAKKDVADKEIEIEQAKQQSMAGYYW